MVLGKLPVPGRPINLDNSKARAVWTFFLSSVISRFLSLGDSLIYTEILSQRAVKP